MDSVAAEAAVAPIVTKFPAVPLTLQLVSVCVVPEVKVNVVGCTVFERVVNVFDPLIVNAPAPPLFSVQLYVEPPPTKVLAEALVRLIVPVPVPAVVVNPVGAALLKAVVPEAAMDKVPPLKVRFLVPVAVRNVAAIVPDSVSVCPFRLSVPLVSVSTPATALVAVNASCSVTVPLGLLIVVP